MEKKKQVQIICSWCGLPFMAQRKGALYCPQCRTFVYKNNPHKRQKNINSGLLSDLRELAAYNKENNTNLSYGKFKLMKTQTERKK